MRLAPIVFAYDFPHKKTQDVIQRLVAIGMTPKAVLAAPPVVLPVPPSPLRVKPRHADLIEPGELCRTLGVEYHVVDHRSETCLMVLDMLAPELGVIAGARILPSAVLERFSRGVVNFHPGILPAVRGLDALQWALYRDLPLGVTAHIIDARVDAGWILERRWIDEYPDDTLIDLSLRLYETQIAMLGSALERAATANRRTLERVDGGPYNRSFPPELVDVMHDRLRGRRRGAA